MSARKFFTGIVVISNLEKLKKCKNRKQLAVLLNIAPSFLSYSLYKTSETDKYTTFQIPKRSGGTRTINAPNSELKTIQGRTSNLLYDCYKVIHPKFKNTNFELSHAFQKERGLSIASNAARHCNRRFVFNLDFQDFFGCFNFGRVRGYFLTNKNFQLENEVATTLAQICCHDNRLPQGAPTSPIVTELITRILDLRIQKIAKDNRCSYSRYADDLTFSTNKKVFPEEIARVTEEGNWAIGYKLLNKIHNSGFIINQTKTRMHYCDSRQEATGLIINKKVNIPKEYSKKVRSMCHSLFTKGQCHVGENPDEKVSTKVLRGMLAHIYFIKSRKNKYLKNETPAFIRQYRDFLYFQNFYNNSKPTILCEGKTDYIYLNCAIKSLYEKFQNLAKKSSNSQKVELLISFFKYSKTSELVTTLKGGSGNFKDFVHGYDKIYETFTAPTESQPVLIVIDSDQGNDILWNMLRGTYKFEGEKWDEKFYFLTKNLYIIPIPKIDNEDTCMEQLFEKNILNTKLNGKSFSYKSDPNIKTEYGKHIFSQKVILKGQNINFSNFEGLLENIEVAISDYSNKLK